MQKRMQFDSFGFGLSGPKREGGKLFPQDYLYMNGTLPKKSMYTKEELEEHKHWGLDAEEWYASE